MSIYTISDETIKSIEYHGINVNQLIYNDKIVWNYTPPAHRYLAGNFKMNLTDAEVKTYFKAFKPATSDLGIIIFPGLASLKTAITYRQSNKIMIGAQDVSRGLRGAYTGQVSARQLAALGVGWVLIGDSEKMVYLNDTYQIANEKLMTSLSCGLKALVCINDFTQDTNYEDALSEQLDIKLNYVSTAQMSEIIIVYEPPFTFEGSTFTAEAAQERCAFIRNYIGQRFDEAVKSRLKILYGGSVKLDNVRILMIQNDIDGLFVGGTSLRVENMMQISSMMVE